MTETQTPASKLPGEYEFEFTEWPFFWLAKADRAYHAILEGAMAKRGLDIPRWRVLMVLHSRRSASVSEIAEFSIVKMSTMTRIVQRMQADGLVQSAQSETDRRVTMVNITPKGDEAGRDAWQAANRIFERAFANFTEIERQILPSLLKKLSAELADL